MQALLLKKNSKWQELVYTCCSEKNPDISELIEDFDAENTKRQKIRRFSYLFKKL